MFYLQCVNTYVFLLIGQDKEVEAKIFESWKIRASLLCTDKSVAISFTKLYFLYRTLNAIAPFEPQLTAKRESGKMELFHMKSMAILAALTSLCLNKPWDIGRTILASNSLKETQIYIRTTLFSLKDLVGKLSVIAVTLIKLNFKRINLDVNDLDITNLLRIPRRYKWL